MPFCSTASDDCSRLGGNIARFVEPVGAEGTHISPALRSETRSSARARIVSDHTTVCATPRGCPPGHSARRQAVRGRPPRSRCRGSRAAPSPGTSPAPRRRRQARGRGRPQPGRATAASAHPRGPARAGGHRSDSRPPPRGQRGLYVTGARPTRLPAPRWSQRGRPVPGASASRCPPHSGSGRRRAGRRYRGSAGVPHGWRCRCRSSGR